MIGSVTISVTRHPVTQRKPPSSGTALVAFGRTLEVRADGESLMTGQWKVALDGFTMWMVAAGATPQTRRLRRHQITRLAQRSGRVGPWQVTGDDLVSFIGNPAWQLETRKSARSAVRSFYRWAEESGRVDVNPARALPPIRVPDSKPRPAPTLVVTDALGRADGRARLMVMLAVYAGLRRGEICKVHTDDVVSVSAGESLRVVGKGGRVRVIPLHPDLAAAIPRHPSGYLFAGRIDGHLSPNHVGLILTRLLGPGWSGHSLRHRFASDSYRGSRDIRAVQELLGHSQVNTTQRYILVPDDDLRAAVLSLPRPRTGFLSGLRRRLHAATV